MAAISASPVRSPLRRPNSSAEITTTSSRPCTVTRCGPSLRTRRTSSLKRAFASCNSHWPVFGPAFGLRTRRRGFVDLAGDDFTILVILTRYHSWPPDFNDCRIFLWDLRVTRRVRPAEDVNGIAGPQVVPGEGCIRIEREIGDRHRAYGVQNPDTEPLHQTAFRPHAERTPLAFERMGPVSCDTRSLDQRACTIGRLTSASFAASSSWSTAT